MNNQQNRQPPPSFGGKGTVIGGTEMSSGTQNLTGGKPGDYHQVI